MSAHPGRCAWGPAPGRPGAPPPSPRLCEAWADVWGRNGAPSGMQHGRRRPAAEARSSGGRAAAAGGGRRPAASQQRCTRPGLPLDGLPAPAAAAGVGSCSPNCSRAAWLAVCTSVSFMATQLMVCWGSLGCWNGLKPGPTAAHAAATAAAACLLAEHDAGGAWRLCFKWSVGESRAKTAKSWCAHSAASCSLHAARAPRRRRPPWVFSGRRGSGR